MGMDEKGQRAADGDEMGAIVGDGVDTVAACIAARRRRRKRERRNVNNAPIAGAAAAAVLRAQIGTACMGHSIARRVQNVWDIYCHCVARVRDVER